MRTPARAVAWLSGMALALVGATGAQAAPGDLIQLSDPFGCISDAGTGGCTLGTALVQTNSVAVSPDGKNVYVTAAQSESVVIFNRDTTTGALTQPSDPNGCVSHDGSGPCISAGDKGLLGPVSVAVSPDGKNVYVGASSIAAVTTLNRSTTTGALSRQTGTPTSGCISETGSGGDCVDGKALDSPRQVTVSPDGKNVYVASSSDAVAILNRDTTTGVLTQPTTTAGCISETGSGGACVDGKALVDPRSVAISPDGGSVYVTFLPIAGDNGNSGVAIFDRNQTSGALTQQTGAPTAGCISETGSGGACVDGRVMDTSFSVVVSPDSENVYVADRRAGGVSAFDRNTTTLALTQKAGTDGCITWNPTTATNETCVLGHDLPFPTSLVVSPDGENVYMTSQDLDGLALFNRDAVTGTLTQRAGTAGCIAGPGFYASHCQAGKAMNDAWSMAVSPDNKSAYVASQVSSAVAVLARGAVAGPGPKPGGGGGGGGGGGANPVPTPTTRLPKTRPPDRFRRVVGSLSRGTLTVTVDAPGAGTVTVQATGTVDLQISGAGATKRVKLKIARASRKVSKAGPVKLVLKPKGQAKKVLRKKGKLKAKLRLTFKPTNGKATSQTRNATFKLKRKNRR